MSADKKRQIFNVAVGLISENGFDDVTVKDICHAAQISNGTFFYYFKTKEDVLGMYLGEVYDEYLADVLPAEDAADYVAYISELSACYGDYCMKAGVDFVSGYYSTRNANLDTHEFSVDNTLNTTMDKTLKALQRAKVEGYVLESLDCEASAIDCCTVIKGSVFEWCVSRGAIDLSASIRRTIGRYLLGWAAEKYRREFSALEE